MITLLLVVSALLACCGAAAGLIASTQNSQDAAQAMNGLALGPDTQS